MKTIELASVPTGESSVVHRFEAAGLGAAPFRFTGEVSEQTYCACPGAPVQPGSTCDYCGTGIRYEFWIVSADGRRSKVGCDCIRKSDDAGLVRAISSAEARLRRAKSAARRKANLEKKAADTAAQLERLPAVSGTLAAQPHPVPAHAAAGRTALDYVRWLVDFGYRDKAAAVIGGVA